MPTESDLRDRMRPPGPGGSGGLDATVVVRAARRRRRPKVLLVGASALAVAAAIVVPAAAIGLRTGASSSAGPAVDTARQPSAESAGKGAAPNGVGQDPCPAAPVAGSRPVTGTLELADASVGAEVRGTLVLSAEAATTVTPNGSAIVILFRDGSVVGQAAATLPGDPVAISPGTGARVPVEFRPVRCGTDTALPAGEYTAQVVFAPDDRVASGPAAPVRIG